MTAVGSRKYDATGRSTGSRKTDRLTRIKPPFVQLRLPFLESPALGALSLSARRVLDRLEIEHMHHGGADNGRLQVPYSAFEQFGIHNNMIAPAIREAVALGFVRITEAGRGGNREFRRPTIYRLTYLPAAGAPPSDEWASIKTGAKAEKLARHARLSKTKSRSQKVRPKPPAQSAGENPEFRPHKVRAKPAVPPPSPSAGTIYILEGGGMDRGALTPQERHQKARAERVASERRLAEATAASKPDREACLAWWGWTVVLWNVEPTDGV